MAAVDELITEHIDIWTSAVKRKSSSGRGGGKKVELYGVKKLRELILDLAVRGLLVPQDPEDEPASVLLERIAAEKAELVTAKVIKKQKELPGIGEKDKPFELPDGWVFKKLGDLAHIFSGNSFKSTDFNNTGGTRAIKITNAGVGHLIETDEYLPKEFRDHYQQYQVLDGDLILALTRPYISTGLKVCICPSSYDMSLLNQRVAAIRTKINNEYLYQFMQSKYVLGVYIERFGNSGLQPNLKMGDVTNLIIPVPPPPEQHRIVAKVNELMALCDQLEQQTEASLTAHQTLVQTLLDALTQAAASQPNNPQSATDALTPFEQAWNRLAEHFDTVFTTEDSIEQLKQTILQLAVMGKLVPQDPNDEPASVLLERIAAEKAELIKAKKIKKQKALSEIVEDEKPFALQKGWEWVRFDDISKNEKNALKAGPFGSALKKSFYVKSGYKIYGQEQVISGDENFGDYYVDREKYLSLESCKVGPGDILISLVGTIGRVLIVSDHAAPGIINPRLVKLSLNNDIDRDYIRIILGSRLMQKELSEKSHGSTMDVLNLGLLRKLQFPLPPVPEQNRIVTKVNELVSQCDLLKDHLKIIQTTRLQLAVAVTDSHSDNSCQGSHSKNGVKAKARKIK